MSYQAVQTVLETTGAKGNARCVLIALAHHANDDGACWPSVDTIAGEANVCRRTAQAMIAQLAEAGEIVVDRNTGPRGSNVYQITACTAQVLPSADPAPVQTVAPPVQHAAPVQTVAPVQIAAPKESYSSFDPKGSQEGDATESTIPSTADASGGSPGRPPRTPRKPRPRPDADPRVRELTLALAEWQGYTACNWPAEAKHAKRIVDAGYTLDDARTVWRRMKGEPFWQDKHLSLANVFAQLGAKLGAPNGRRRDPIVLEPVRRGGAS